MYPSQVESYVDLGTEPTQGPPHPGAPPQHRATFADDCSLQPEEGNTTPNLSLHDHCSNMVASGPVVDEREKDHHSWNHKVLVPEDADLPYSLSTEDGEVASPLNPRMDNPERPETDCTLEDDDTDSSAVAVESQHEDRIVPVAPPDVEVWKYYREER